jgi:hydroxymethylbilane synthase
MKLRLGTRGSDLALTQAATVAAELGKSGVEAELVVISTSGDRSAAPTFGSIGPQGVFVREIEQALLDGRVDLAVHSCKDLPTTSPDGLVIGALPKRRDAADWLLYKERGQSPFAEGKRALTPSLSLPLRRGARVGTSSARRQAWLRHFRPDFAIEPLRGNVPTRLKRLAAGDFDAILLAGAGIERLTEATDVLDEALAKVGHLRLDPGTFVPAPAQGALAVQCREDDAGVRATLAAIDDAATRAAVELERRALALAEAGCDAAFGAYAKPDADGLELIVMSEAGGRVTSVGVTSREHSDPASEAMRRLQAQSVSAQ